MKRTLSILLAAAALALLGTGRLQAQAIWTSAQIDLKFGKGFSGYVEGEYRSLNQVAGNSRWSGSLGFEYKPIDYFKTTIGYSYLHDYEEEDLTNKGNIVSSYWQPRHRMNVALTGSYGWDFGLKISLRERYQYTFNQEMSVPKTDPSGTQLDNEIVNAKHKHVLRSRLQIAYEIPTIKLEPYLYCEMYNDLLAGFKIDKVRYQAGLSYPITKMHSIKLYYMFQDHTKVGKKDDHIIGIGYKLKIKTKKK